jgi:hypothetical protein
MSEPMSPYMVSMLDGLDDPEFLDAVEKSLDGQTPWQE